MTKTIRKDALDTTLDALTSDERDVLLASGLDQLTAVTDEISTTPHPADANTRRQEDERTARLVELHGLKGRLLSLLHHVEHPKQALDPSMLREWRNTLRQARLDITAVQKGIDPEDRTKADLLEGCARSLVVIADGPSEAVPTPVVLNTWMEARHVHAIYGERSVFTGRGGLVLCEHRLQEIIIRLRETWGRLSTATQETKTALAV